MNRFFHVDRTLRLKEGQEINLIKYDDIRPEELQEHVNFLYPEGVSSHGNHYILTGNTFANDSEPIIELLFEYVRRSDFPQRTSRFQSFFAFDNLELAQDFILNYWNSAYNIWEVQADRYFKADMNLLSLKDSLLVLDYRAHLYWKGETIGNPFWEYLLVPPVKVIRKVDG